MYELEPEKLNEKSLPKERLEGNIKNTKLEF